MLVPSLYERGREKAQAFWKNQPKAYPMRFRPCIVGSQKYPILEIKRYVV